MAKKKEVNGSVCHYCTDLFPPEEIYWVDKWAYAQNSQTNWKFGVPTCKKCMDKNVESWIDVIQEPKVKKTKKKKDE